MDKAKDSGATPLSIASANGHVEVVNALLAIDADKNIQASGLTAISMAKHKGHEEVVALLQ